jgi:hypothetical protein
MVFVILEDSIVLDQIKTKYSESYPYLNLSDNKQVLFLPHDLIDYNEVEYFLNIVEYNEIDDTIDIKLELIYFFILHEKVVSELDIRLVSNDELKIVSEKITPIGITRKSKIYVEIED